MLRHTSLAHDLLAAIVAGLEAAGASLRKLHLGFPELWDEPRERCLVEV